MPRGKPDPTRLAGEVQRILDQLFMDGYEKEVVVIRKFIAAMGDSHKEQMRMQHLIAADLARGSSRTPQATQDDDGPEDSDDD